jgi:hypothetical protein
MKSLTLGLGALVIVLIAVGPLRGQAPAPSAPGSAPPPATAATPTVVRTFEAGLEDDSGEGAPTRIAAVPEDVTIQVRSAPRAHVRWGPKGLGTTPLKLVRPHDSGPLDLTLSASGYLPHHVRAYTFKDETLNVKLVPVSQASTVFGYPQSLDAGVAEAPPETPPETPLESPPEPH